MAESFDYDRQFELIANGGVLSPENQDVSINEPERVRDELGLVIHEFTRIEREVDPQPLLVMLPKAGTEYRGYQSRSRDFIALWYPQEQGHGAIGAYVEEEIGLTPYPVEVSVPLHNRLMGLIGNTSDAMHASFEMIYLSRGAMHETAALKGWDLVSKKAAEIDEPALAQTFRKIRNQEGPHKGFYFSAAHDLKQYLDPWQLRLVRLISVKTYEMVGAGEKQHQADIGRVTKTIVGDDLAAIRAYGEEIHHVAEKLLIGDDEALDLEDFVTPAIQKYLLADDLRQAA